MDKPVERQKLYNVIKDVYANGVEMTARECAVKLFNRGIIPYPLRDFVAPRLTEMCKMGWFETVGSTYDRITHKTVTVYRKVG